MIGNLPVNYTVSTASDLADQNLEKQNLYYTLSTRVDDLVRLFGFLSAQEREDSLKSALSEHEVEKERWGKCYRAIETINSSLTNVSRSGLRQSLEQYGPLINQVYQKFIRHELFAADQTTFVEPVHELV